MTPVETLTLVAYFFVLIVLAIYGWHRYYLVYLYMSNRGKEPQQGPPPDPLPVVTIQLPLYNEMYVADRLIDAVCRIDYPRELVEIQVLDDSVDETRSIAESAVRRFAAQGIDIKYFHREDRVGFKAGALEAGLKTARGEFIAIFDADFLPTSDFLTRLAPQRDRRCRRLAARYAHRGFGSQLPRAASRLAVRLPLGFDRAGRSAGRDERLQVAAASLGEGIDSNLQEAAAQAPARQAAAR